MGKEQAMMQSAISITTEKSALFVRASLSLEILVSNMADDVAVRINYNCTSSNTFLHNSCFVEKKT